MSILIGVDFSINSPAICINIDDKEYHYYNIFRHSKLTKKEVIAIDILKEYSNLEIFFNESDQKSKNYIERELNNLTEAEFLTNSIISFLNKYVKEKANVVIEGFSYSSNGNRLAELAGYQYILRHELRINGFELSVCSPKTIKATAGKGNFNKEQTIDAYLRNEEDENDKLKEFLIKHRDILRINDKYFVKPIDDLIDAFWAMKTAKNFF